MLAEMPLDAKFDASVFETIIRVVGGLLAAHDLTGDPAMLARWGHAGDGLLVRVVAGWRAGGPRPHWGPRSAGAVSCCCCLCLAGACQGRRRAPPTQICLPPPLPAPLKPGAAGGGPPAACCPPAPPAAATPNPPSTHMHPRPQGAAGGGPPAARLRHAHRHPAEHHQPAHAGGQEPHLEPAVRPLGCRLPAWMVAE